MTAQDFGSLHQPPYSAGEDQLFQVGRRASGLWYGHRETICWMQTELPMQFDRAPYDASGWCYVESAISAVIKPGTKRLDLGKRTKETLDGVYGGSWRGDNMRLDRACAASRAPPSSPEVVMQVLQTEKWFTDVSDVEAVADLYYRFFESIAAGTTSLDYSNVSWQAPEVRTLCGVLPRFQQIALLDFSNNQLGSAEAQALVDGGLFQTTLRSLSVAHNKIVGDGAQQLASVVLAKPTFESFSGIPLMQLRSDSITSLDLKNKGLGVPEAMVLADLIGSVTSSLKDINLSFNNLTGGKYVKESSLPGSNYKMATKVLHEGLELSVLREKDSDGELLLGTVAGVIALADALQGNSSLTKCDVRWNGLGDEGDTALREAVKGRDGFELLL